MAGLCLNYVTAWRAICIAPALLPARLMALSFPLCQISVEWASAAVYTEKANGCTDFLYARGGHAARNVTYACRWIWIKPPQLTFHPLIAREDCTALAAAECATIVPSPHATKT